MRFLCLFIVIFSYGQSYSQISDSLYAAIPHEAKPVDKMHITLDNKLALLHSVFKDDLIKYNDEVSKIVTGLESQLANADTDRMIRISAALGCYYFKMTDMKAKSYYSQILQNVIHMKKPERKYYQELSEAYAAISQISLFENHIDSSLIMLDLLKRIVRPSDTSSLFKMYSTYDDIYTTLGQFQQALDYEYLCIGLMDTTNFRHDRILAYKLLIAGSHILLFEENGKQLHADSARYYINTILNDKPDEVRKWMSECSYCLGKLLFFEGKYNEALTMFNRADSTRTDINEQYISGSKMYNDVYRLLTKLRLGNERVIQSLESYDLPRRTTRLKILVFKELYHYWEGKRNWQKAYKYLSEYKVYSDSIDAENNKYKLFEINQKYKFSEKESAIKALEIDKLKRSRMLWLMGGILLLGIGGIIIYVRYARLRTNRKEAASALNTQKLINKLNDIEIAHHNEIISLNKEKENSIRNHKLEVSRTIHDEISNGIAALRYYITDLKHNVTDDIVQNLLASIEDEAAALYTHTREYMNALRDNAFERNKHINSFLDSLEMKFSLEGNFRIDIQADKEKIDTELTGKFQTALYYILKEAVINSIKHAEANRIIIKIDFRESICYFSISDNGTGIRKEESPDGMGIQNMKSRIQELGGEVNVSGNEHGTSVTGSFRYGHPE